MSQEFERKVLEKLENFEGRFDRIEKTLNEHTKILNEHTKTLNEHTDILNDHTEQFNKVRKDIYDVNNKIIKSANVISELSDVVEYNTQTIKKYNEENAKKIDVSLKAYEQLNTKVKMKEIVISNLKSKDFQNDIRISALEEALKQKGITA